MLTPNDLHDPSDLDATFSSNQAAARMESEEDEPSLRMLLSRQEESMRLQEERHSVEIKSLWQEMNDRIIAIETNQHSKEATSTIPSKNINVRNGSSIVAALNYNIEQFEDNAAYGPNDAQLHAGDGGGSILKRSGINPWMYDLAGSDEETDSAQFNHESNNTSIISPVTVKTRSVDKEGITVSYGDNEQGNQNVMTHVPFSQQTREHFAAVYEEEFVALKDQRKQQEERIQFLEEKIQQIENQGNNDTITRRRIPTRYSIFRTFTEILPPSENSDYFSRDTFTMMMLHKICSRSWILGTTSFCFQMVLGTMIAIDQLKASTGTSIFNVPFKVDTEVRIAQILSILICLSIQSDVLTSIKTLVLLGRGSNWRQVIRINEHSSTCGLWTVRIGIPNTMKLVQGLTVAFVSFVIIVQADEIIDLLKDFTALMIISETDNILYQLAIRGYLGEQLHREALQIEQKKKESASVLGSSSERQARKSNGLAFVRLVSLLLLGGMLGGWGIIFQNQRNGVYFKQKFPDCDFYELALEHFGDGVCYGGALNTIECKFEDGDCINFNTAYPNCKGKGLEGLVNVEDELGKGECNMAFAIPECDYDGGLCCPYDIQRGRTFRDGQCHSGKISSIGCDWDGGDCLNFIKAYPDCNIESGKTGTVFGNDICEGGYTTEECGYEATDCDFGQVGGDNIFAGILSPFDNGIHFDMKMSSDGSMIFIKLPHTNPSGKFDRSASGRVSGYLFDSSIARWVEQPVLEGQVPVRRNENFLAPSSWAVNEDSNIVAIGSMWDDNGTGRVDVYDFFGTNGFNHNPQEPIFGEYEKISSFGAQVDMTADGLRMAISSEFRSEWRTRGMIQVFQLDQSEQKWAQVGDNIFGKSFGERIGYYNLQIDSFYGTRVIFDAFTIPIIYDDDFYYNYYSQQEGLISYFRGYELNLNSHQWVQIGDDILSISDDCITNKLGISEDGSRIAISSYSMMTSRPGEVNIFDLITDPFSNERKWSQLGPTIFGNYSGREYNGSNGDGFGRGISMSADGNLLVVTSVSPSCDGLNMREVLISIPEISLYDEFASTSEELCVTGSIQMYQYKYTNPPHRPFTTLPYKRNDLSFQNPAEQVRAGTIQGLHVSLSGDGSMFAVSGLDLTGKYGFAKTYNTADLFYVDCIVEDAHRVGDGDCPYDEGDVEPYYTEQCGYDGGDCPPPSQVDGFGDCKVANPGIIGSGQLHCGGSGCSFCYDYLPYNSEQCGYQGGDCPLPTPVGGYPNCSVSFPEKVGDGKCDGTPYNSYGCGFDGGDCLPEKYAPSSSPSKSNQPSHGPSISLSPTKSVQPSTGPTSGPSSEPSLTNLPSQSSLSVDPNKSTMPTQVSIAITLTIFTDGSPEDMTWSLINESDGDAVIITGPEEDEGLKGETLYTFTWILSRCNSYKFQIFDSKGNGFSSSDSGLAFSLDREESYLGILQGDFGSEGIIHIYICDGIVNITNVDPTPRSINL